MARPPLREVLERARGRGGRVTYAEVIEALHDERGARSRGVIVPDSSAIVPALIDTGGDGALTREILDADGDLHAPYLLDVEVVSVLRRLTFKGAITPERGEQALLDYDDLDIARYPHLGLVSRMWALRSNVSAYDAAYVALAETLGATLLTADGKLAAATGPACQLRLLADPVDLA